MYILKREDGASFASCSIEHAIALAGFLEGLDVTGRYRPFNYEPKSLRTLVCLHCGLCGRNAFPGHDVCDVHGFDGITCPDYDIRSTLAYIFGAAAACCFDETADLDQLEELVEDGGWERPDRVVYEVIQRYRP